MPLMKRRGGRQEMGRGNGSERKGRGRGLNVVQGKLRLRVIRLHGCAFDTVCVWQVREIQRDELSKRILPWQLSKMSRQRVDREQFFK